MHITIANKQENNFHASMHPFSVCDDILNLSDNSHKLEQGPFSSSCTKNDANLKLIQILKFINQRI
jgi:hypothetical protein